MKLFIILFCIGILLFYGIPLIALLLPAEFGMLFYVLSLLIINPLFMMASCLIHTIKNGFKWYLPFALGLLFAPAVFFIYNQTAAIYIIVYAIIGLVGSSFGFLIRKR